MGLDKEGFCNGQHKVCGTEAYESVKVDFYSSQGWAKPTEPTERQEATFGHLGYDSC